MGTTLQTTGPCFQPLSQVTTHTESKKYTDDIAGQTEVAARGQEAPGWGLAALDTPRTLKGQAISTL